MRTIIELLKMFHSYSSKKKKMFHCYNGCHNAQLLCTKRYSYLFRFNEKSCGCQTKMRLKILLHKGLFVIKHDIIY